MLQSAAIAVTVLAPLPAAAQGSLSIVGATREEAVPALTGAPSSLAPAVPYQDLIDTISHSHGIDPRLTRAVIEVESAFDPRAVSAKGALGLMQLIPETGRRFGVNNFFDPADNIGGGVRFLRFLIDKFGGNADLVLAAYNSGENRVERLGRIPQIPETVAYVRKVRAVYDGLGGDVLSVEQRGSDRRQPEGPAIYRNVDERGVMTFSSFGPTR